MSPERGPDGKFLPSNQGSAVAEPPADEQREAPPAPETGDKKDKGKAKPEDMSGANALARSFLENRKVKEDDFKPEKDEKKEKEQVEKEKKDKETSAKKAAAAKPKPKPRVPIEEPEQALSAEKIAAAAAEGVARVIGKKADKDAAPDAAALDEEDQQTFAVLAKMEKLNPSKYKDISARWKKGQLNLYSYIQKWKKENPGKEFNMEDEEHQPFLDENDVAYSDTDFRRAEIRMEAEALNAEDPERKKTAEELEALKRGQKLGAETPNIAREQGTASKLLWKAWGEDFDIITQDGELDLEKARALQTKDSVTFGIRVNAGQMLDIEVAELYKLMTGLADFKKGDPLHQRLAVFADAQERRMLALDKGERLDEEGRSFLPYEKYMQKPKEQREEYYWTFSPTDLAAIRAKQLADTTQKTIEAEEKRLAAFAKARGYTKDGQEKTVSGKEQKEDENADTTETEDGKPDSPSSGTQSKLAARAKSGGNEDQSPSAPFFNRFLNTKANQ